MIEYLQYLCQMTRDIFTNAHRIVSLASFEYTLGTKGFVLGRVWKLLNPLIQIGVYWLVFGIGLRSGKPIDGVPYVVWLVCGLTPWLVCNQGVSITANAIYSKATMLTRSNIPTYLIPISSALSVLMNSGWNVALLVVIYLGNGCVPTWTSLGLLYYVVCIFAFISALSLVTSVLVMLARDFSQLIQAIMRMVYFLSPIFWKPGNGLPAAFQWFDSCNPFGYIIRGFRDSLLFNTPFWEDTHGMLVFWEIVLALYLLGALCQSKLRKNLLDFL